LGLAGVALADPPNSPARQLERVHDLALDLSFGLGLGVASEPAQGSLGLGRRQAEPGFDVVGCL